MGLARNIASPARTWAAAFACRLVNSILEFVKKAEKRALQDAITFPHSEISSLRERKVSHVTFESSSKSTLSKAMSLSHWRASNKPIASPTATWCRQGKLTILKELLLTELNLFDKKPKLNLNPNWTKNVDLFTVFALLSSFTVFVC